MRLTPPSASSLHRRMLSRTPAKDRGGPTVQEVIDHFREHRELPYAEKTEIKRPGSSWRPQVKRDFKAMAEADESQSDNWTEDKGHLLTDQGKALLRDSIGEQLLEAELVGDTEQGSYSTVQTFSHGTDEEFRVYEEVIFDEQSVSKLKITGVAKGIPIAELDQLNYNNLGGLERRVMQVAGRDDFEAWAEDKDAEERRLAQVYGMHAKDNEPDGPLLERDLDGILVGGHYLQVQ